VICETNVFKFLIDVTVLASNNYSLETRFSFEFSEQDLTVVRPKMFKKLGLCAWPVLALFGSLSLLSSPIVQSAVIFEDSFTTLDLSKTMSGAKWNGRAYVDAVDAPSIIDPGVAQFYYQGSTDVNEDSFSELRFDLGGLYPEIWLQFYLYIPANYEHRDAPGPDNNKVLRLWGSDYNNVEKVGLSVWSDGGGNSQLIADWNRNGDGIGPKGDVARLIGPEDRGSWMKIRVHVVAARSSSSPGSIRVWKNDDLIINNFQTVDSFFAGEAHAYRYGYLLGWSNSGFDETTRLFIDDVVFATNQSDLDSGGSISSPPSPPEITIE